MTSQRNSAAAAAGYLQNAGEIISCRIFNFWRDTRNGEGRGGRGQGQVISCLLVK